VAFFIQANPAGKTPSGGWSSELFQDKGVGIELRSAALCSQFGMQEDFAG
jgi:hypothetical protein